MRTLSVGRLFLGTLVYLSGFSLRTTPASALHGGSLVVRFHHTAGDALRREDVTVPKADSLSNSDSISKAESTPKTGTIPKNESTSKTGAIPKDKSTPKTGAIPKDESTPKTGAIPKNESTPKTGAIPKNESTPRSGAIPKAESTPKTGAIQKDESTPKTAAIPNTGSVPEADLTRKTSSIPKAGSILKVESTPKTSSIPKAGSILKAESTPKTGSISKAGSVLKSTLVSKAHSVSKSKPVPEADTIPEAGATDEAGSVPTVESITTTTKTTTTTTTTKSSLLFESRMNPTNDELERNTVGRPNHIDSSMNQVWEHAPDRGSDTLRLDNVCGEEACPGSNCVPGPSPENGSEDLERVEKSAVENGNIFTLSKLQKEFDIYNCTWICDRSGVDCSRRNFLSVPQRLPKTIKILLLSKNSIELIQPCAFCRYPNLTGLYLDGNRLQNLSEKSFQNLTRLQRLSLKGNFLAMKNGTYPENVFSDLKSLKILSLNNNTPCTTWPEMFYPDLALSALSNLEHLRIDGLCNKSFGPGFKNLKALKSIEMGGKKYGYCTMKTLTNRTFENVPTIKHLFMRWCSIYGDLVEAGTFKPLKNLETLNVYGNYYLKFKYLQSLMWGLKYSNNLQQLDIGRIESMFSSSIIVSDDMVKNFPRSLKSLHCVENKIELLERSVLSNLPKGLIYIDASGNNFAYSSYLRNLSKLENLKTLLLNGKITLESLPNHLPKERGPNFFSRHNQNLASPRKQLPYEHSLDSDEEEFLLPPRLVNISLAYAGLKFRLTKFSINPNNSLRHLSIWANYFPYATGPIAGLKNVTRIDMNGSFISHLSTSFFQPFPELTHLDLSTNFLRDTYTPGSKIQLFKHLTNLKYLNLSINLIQRLPEDAFAGLNNLQSLDLSQNSIEDFSQNLWNMSQLKYLSLRATGIRNLNSDLTRFFDTRGHNLTLDLSGCPVRCTCDNLDFLRWMINSKALNKSFEGYACVYKDGIRKGIHEGYQGIVRLLDRECSNHFPLFLWVLALTILLLCVVIGLLVYRFRWKLRYFYYAAYILCKEREKTKEEEFQFDVFISYASPDEQFVLRSVVPELTRRGVKPHVHGRHFTAGDYIASNIVSAVKNSRKTLVILTEQMLDSYWCTYELQMANLESVHSGRRVLVFLLKDNIPRSRLGLQLLYHIRNNTYMPYPTAGSQGRNPEVITAFWDKMARDLLNS
ncbi:toll-like receptor 4 [Aplysia californica]|uniref:Toll-like receptor 4 n=1 Tax=Aplysia californica TaxID=6500 RepID=A0ABM1AES7_APLCA|nr:toll-like receptor 4 [Aplysia californica]